MRNLLHLCRPRAFTLVELLVTIGILAILSSLLLVSLSRGREKAGNIQCLNNLRQFGLALSLYAEDHTGLLPALISVSGTNILQGNRAWDVPLSTTDKLFSYGLTRQTIGCPDRPELRADAAWNYHTNYRVIGYCLATRGAPRIAKTNTFYSMNTLAPILEDDFLSSPTLAPVRARPESTILVADPILSAGGNTVNRELNRYSGLGGGYDYKGRTVDHQSAHMKGKMPFRSHASFADGHVTSRRFLDTLARSEREPTFWW